MIARLSTPPDIEREMKMWRLGLTAIPTSYINWHRDLAYKARDILARTHTIHREWIAKDGWMDGMRVVFLIVETRDGNGTGDLLKLSWSDSGQRFFQHYKSGGSGIYDAGPHINDIVLEMGSTAA